MDSAVRNWRVRYVLALKEGVVPLQILLDVPDGLFEALFDEYPSMDGCRVLSKEGIALVYWVTTKEIPAPSGPKSSCELPFYEVHAAGQPIYRVQTLAEALDYIRGMVP